MSIQHIAAIITGASRGLGRALALRLADHGVRLALVGRTRAPLEAVVAEVRARGGEAHAIVADVSDKHAVPRIAGTAGALLGDIDLLINNASTLGPTPLRLLLDTECEDLEQVLETNLVGPFRLTKAVAGSMLLRQRGTVVDISSDAAVEAYPAWGIYSASKAALDHLSRVWAAELGGQGVRFLAVDPSELNTQMHAAALPDADPSTLTDPADAAAVIVAMIRDGAAAPNGARLRVSDWPEAVAS